MEKKSIADAIEYCSNIQSAPDNEVKKSYEKKLDESSERVYKYNYSQKPKPTKKLKKTIDRAINKPILKDINGDVDNIILIAVSCLGLHPNVADRTKLIMARMWSYPDNFHDLKYENVVLGILMYVAYEDCSEATAVDLSRFCVDMFGTAQSKRYTRQMYEAYEIVRDLYPEVEREYQELAQQIWREKQKVYIYPT